MKISCIIPAYNEEKNIKNIINDIYDTNFFDEIIVINDGSEDKTAEIIEQEISAGKNIIFINLSQNIGKGGAVWHGLQKTTGEIIVTLDADLIGIKRDHLEKLARPLLQGESEICIGIIKHQNKKWISFIQRRGSDLSGQQAFFKHLVEDADIKNSGFGLEIILKKHFQEKNARTKKIFLEEVTHLLKEEKLGIKSGFLTRLKMYKEMLAAIIMVVIGKLK